jgi:hypothetical protein
LKSKKNDALNGISLSHSFFLPWGEKLAEEDRLPLLRAAKRNGHACMLQKPVL